MKLMIDQETDPSNIYELRVKQLDVSITYSGCRDFEDLSHINKAKRSSHLITLTTEELNSPPRDSF
jgi:hypothetical protein